MPYFKSINLLLIHIPKTGGSSVEDYFYNITNEKKGIVTLYSDMRILYNNHSLQHSTYKEIKDLNWLYPIDYENIKIITIVRNPYDRIISDLFFYKMITIDMDKNEIFKNIEIFINSKGYDNHNLPQYEYLVDDTGDINKNIIILRTESLTQDMINAGYKDFDIYSNVTYRNKINYQELLSNYAIELINKFYKKDFEMFKYEYILPKNNIKKA